MAPSRGGSQLAATTPSARTDAAGAAHRWLAVALLLMQLLLVTARVPLPGSAHERRRLKGMGISGSALGPVGHAAPCDDGTGGLEVACLGAPAYLAANPDATPWCCSTTNYWCGTNSTGAPRCATCPAVCIMACDAALGERCLLDRGCTCRPGGCSRCLQNCAAMPCAAGKVCLDGYCHTDPCTADPCAGTPGTPVCLLSANFTVECVPGPECSTAQPCPGGQVCVGGACQVDPCAQYDCPSRSRPKCTLGEAPAYQPTCVAECGDAAACPEGKVCADGGCIADPCSPNQCPAETPDCLMGPGPDFNATCVRRCSDADPCPNGQFCANATCRANPCVGFDCPDETPRCIVGRAPSFLPYCISTGEILGGANCSPNCTLPDVCQQIGGTKRWRCAPPRPTPVSPRRRQPLVYKPQAAAAAAMAATAAADSDDASGDAAEDWPGLRRAGAAAAMEDSGQGGGVEGKAGEAGLP